MLKVILFTNLRSPYMVGYLNELGKTCELTAVFELEQAKGRENAWLKSSPETYREIRLGARQIRPEAGFSLRALPYLFKGYDRIIIANPTTPTGILLLLTCRIFRIPHIIQSEGGFQGSGRGAKERFKRFLMGKARLYLTGMGGEDDYFLKYGATPGKLRPFPFTSLWESDLPARVPTGEEKHALREKLGLPEGKIILSVGQFIYRKGYDILIRASTGFPAGSSVILIGGKPTEEYLLLSESLGLTNLRFVPFMEKAKLLEYYAAADLFVLPTREDTWGLVINEAMAAGLPVITTDRCIAGVQLIREGENGMIIPTDDPDALSRAVCQMLTDPALAAMGENNLQKMRTYTIERMAKAIFAALEEPNG